MSTPTVSVSFSDGFVGNYSRNNVVADAVKLSSLGWTNVQFEQTTSSGQFYLNQGNDCAGVLVLTDYQHVQHRIDVVMNWRGPSNDVNTIVFYAAGTANQTVPKLGGVTTIVPAGATSGTETFIGLTFNGDAVPLTNGSMTGNAATNGLLKVLNDYLTLQPHLSIGDASVNEGAGTVNLTVTLSSAASSAVTVNYASQDASAHVGTDYQAASGTLTFAAGETSKTITLHLVDNATTDGTRTANVVLSASTNAGITDNTGVLTITDNDLQHVASVAPVAASAVEGQTLQYTVTLDTALNTVAEYALGVTGSATAADLGALSFSDGVTWKGGSAASGIVSVPAGVASFKVSLPTVDDTLPENTETVILTVGSQSATASIQDNDVPSVVRVLAEDAAHLGAAPADTSVTEGGALVYTVVLNGAANSAHEYSLSPGGSATAADYGSLSFSDGVSWKNADPNSGVVVVPANVASFKISVGTIDNTTQDAERTLVLSVGGQSGAGSIVDNDAVHVASVSAEDAAHLGASPLDDAVQEGAALQYTVVLTMTGVGPTEFTLGTEGSASAADFGSFVFSDGVAWKGGLASSGIVVVPAGVGSFTVSVPTVDDTNVEQAETLVLRVDGVTGSASITDNDHPSVAAVIAEDAAHVGLSPADTSVIEGGTLCYTVQLNAAGSMPTEFAFELTGTASAADLRDAAFTDGVHWKDGNAASGLLVVPAGVGSFKITVATVDDHTIESAESLTASVANVHDTGTIVDNDSQAVTGVAIEDALHAGASPVDSIVEEGRALLVTVTLNSAAPTSSEYTLTLGGSAAGPDLGALVFSDGVAWKNGDPASHLIVVPAGVAGFTATLPTIDDALIESAESVTVSVGSQQAGATITDNDALAVAGVVAQDGGHPGQTGVIEGAMLAYTVTLNVAATAPTEFALALGGTATGADLGALHFDAGVAWKNGAPDTHTVVVGTGVSSFHVLAPTIDDSIVESAESVVLVVGGVNATGTILDNDVASAPVPAPLPSPAPAPVPAPTPALQTALDPASDDGASHSDGVTSVITPSFTIDAPGLLAAGSSVRLLSPAGAVVADHAVSAADIAAGKIDIAPGVLDDGVYTYTAQVTDAGGKVVASSPVTVTVVTDQDGIAPSVESAAFGGDYNKDGVADWQQHTVALMPLASMADFKLGASAPTSSFGALIAGSITQDTDAVALTSGAQLKDLSLTDLPAALPEVYRDVSPVFNFTVTAEQGVASLPDLDPSRAGLQTRVVIDLGATGVAANDFVKFDKASGTWFSFLDDQNLATMDDGATLVDLNGDGRVDRIVITLTDGARGDEDGIANGVIVDPGLLSFNKTLPNQVYSIKLAGGDTYYTADVAEAAHQAAGTGNVFTGVVFDSMAGVPGSQHVSNWYQPFTQDYAYAVDGQALPYSCYGKTAGASGFAALAAGSAGAADIHLYQNAQGKTELVSLAEAADLGLAAHGYTDRGAEFSATLDNAFKFDAEGYLIANHDNAAVQALVQQLAGSYTSTGAAGFIEAVEQNYFQQIQLVGVVHGAAATAADLNAMFGTSFGA